MVVPAVNITLEQGTDFENAYTVTNPDGTSLDLTGYTAAAKIIKFSGSSPSPEAFTDYSSIIEENVINWLESNLNVGYLHTILANEIASQYNPPIEPLHLPLIKIEELERKLGGM